MSSFRNCGVIFAVLAMAACQKSATEERSEAVNAQREATETAQQAANDRQKEVSEANQEAAKDISAARRDAHERSLEAVENEIQRTSGAQAKANEKVDEANKAAVETRDEFAKDARGRLDKIDERSRELHHEFEKKSAKDVPAESRTRLSQVDRESQSMRTDLTRLDTGTPEAIQDVQTSVEKRLTAAEKTLDDID
jgi:hypothetical protein